MSWHILSLTPPVKLLGSHTHTQTQCINKMLIDNTRSTLDWWIRVHKHTLGLKWTLAPSSCFSSSTPRSCPREGGQNSYMHMEQPLTHSQYARKCLCVCECVHIWRRHCSTLHTPGSAPEKDMGLNERMYMSECMCVFIWGFMTEISMHLLYAIYDCIQCTNTPCSHVEFSKLP